MPDFVAVLNPDTRVPGEIALVTDDRVGPRPLRQWDFDDLSLNP